MGRSSFELAKYFEQVVGLDFSARFIASAVELNKAGIKRYVIKDEVLKVTSEQLRDGEVYTVTYNVADLVIPIPNFVPNQRMGLSGAYHDALGQVGFGGGGPLGGMTPAPMAVLANSGGSGGMNSGVAALTSYCVFHS